MDGPGRGPCPRTVTIKCTVTWSWYNAALAIKVLQRSHEYTPVADWLVK